MLTKAQKLRLRALTQKADKTDAEKAELATLVAAAKTAGYKYDEKTGEPVEGKLEDDGTLDEGEVKALVVESVAKAMGGLGLTEETVKAIKDSLAAGASAPNAEDIQKAIKDAVGGAGVDPEVLAKAVRDNLPKNAVTTDGVKKLLDEFKAEVIEATRRDAKMRFPVDTGCPIEHRCGNLNVAQKQLLNLCLMGVSDEALALSDGRRGIARPKSINDGIPAEMLKSASTAGMRMVKSMQDCALRGKAWTSTGSGTGDEFVNTDLSSDIQSRLYLESQLAAALLTSEIQMPSNPFELPITTTRTTFYKGSENTAPSASDAGSGKVTLSAGKLIGKQEYSYEAEEDAIVAILPILQAGLAAGAAESFEDVLVNGDTTATHMDSDIHALGATDRRKLFKGFRKLALAGSISVDLATGGISAANIGAMMKKMGKYGVRPQDLLLVFGTAGLMDALVLDQTLTVDKAGQNAARILTGLVPSLFGIPVLVSSSVRENLNASGVYDGETTTKGSVLLIHRPSFFVGVRRGVTVEVDVDKSAQTNKIIASFRRDLQPMETPTTSLPMVCIGYNYDSGL